MSSSFRGKDYNRNAVPYTHGVIIHSLLREEKERPMVSSCISTPNVLAISPPSFCYFFFPLLTTALRVPWAYLDHLPHTWVESDLCKTASHHVKTAGDFGSGQNCPNKTPEKWPKWKLISQRGPPPGTFQECTPLLQKHRPYCSILP